MTIVRLDQPRPIYHAFGDEDPCGEVAFLALVEAAEEDQAEAWMIVLPNEQVYARTMNEFLDHLKSFGCPMCGRHFPGSNFAYQMLSSVTLLPLDHLRAAMMVSLARQKLDARIEAHPTEEPLSGGSDVPAPRRRPGPRRRHEAVPGLLSGLS